MGYSSTTGEVDVCLMTWNSNKPWFKLCLESFKQEIPISRFIVIDRFSEDGTIDQVKETFPNSLIIKSSTNLGKARAIAIRRVKTPWFVFVDDDVELCEGLFERIREHIDEKVGAVMGNALPMSRVLREYLISQQELRRILRKPLILARGIYLHNTLVRRSIIEDWSPPSWLCLGEDAHLSMHIYAKGYETVRVYDLIVNHYIYSNLLKSARKRLWHSAGMRVTKFGNLSLGLLLRRWAVSIFRGSYITFKMRNPLFFIYEILFSYYRGF